ncbi:hypothetical protein DPMN_014949 [Dreissena polymorpha]|uniref:CCHC-type domain-containing protein n=1 Tax=Dreissena polymorpha TaxID=45954 RepID=A0A9D4NAM2_DREPO|nr:hypothetical protein DPMN_014949 [Dreissena polymorpha]
MTLENRSGTDENSDVFIYKVKYDSDLLLQTRTYENGTTFEYGDKLPYTVDDCYGSDNELSVFDHFECPLIALSHRSIPWEKSFDGILRIGEIIILDTEQYYFLDQETVATVYLISSIVDVRHQSASCVALGIVLHFSWLMVMFEMNVCTYHMFYMLGLTRLTTGGTGSNNNTIVNFIKISGGVLLTVTSKTGIVITGALNQTSNTDFMAFRNGHRDFRNGYHDFRKGHHDFRNGHHNFIRQHDLRNAHLDTRSEYQDCHNENRDFRYVRRHVNHENSRHCTNCGRKNHATRDCRLPKRQ